MVKHKHQDLKLSAVHYHLKEGDSFLETARIFGSSPRSIKRWIDQYREEGHIERHHREAVSYKTQRKHVDITLQKLRENNQITMERLHRQLEEEFSDFTIGRRQVGNILRDLNQTRKRTKRVHFPEKRFNKPIDFREEMQKFMRVVKQFD